VLTEVTTRRSKDGAEPVEVEQWATTLVAHIGAAVEQAADLDGLIHALRSRALADRISEGQDGQALARLADEVAAVAVEHEAARVLAQAEADLEGP